MTGTELKALRISAGLTQTELAKLVRVYGQVNISKYEKGLRTISEPMALLFRFVFLRETVNGRQYAASRAMQQVQAETSKLYGRDAESVDAHRFQGMVDEASVILKLIDEILAH